MFPVYATIAEIYRQKNAYFYTIVLKSVGGRKIILQNGVCLSSLSWRTKLGCLRLRFVVLVITNQH